MKKIIALSLSCALLLCAGCNTVGTGSSSSVAGEAGGGAERSSIKVGASTTPHAEILEVAKPLLEREGYELVIQEFVDYVQPNIALQNGELDANYFQHKPHMDAFNEENNAELVSLAAIHYEPFGIYAGKSSSLEEIAQGAKIAVPNDTSNETRALLLLEANGIIKLKDSTDLNATKLDIVENPYGCEIVEIEAAQLARSLPDVDFAVVNGNYAIAAGLSISDALAIEEKDSFAVSNYANIVAIRAGDENREDLKALAKVLQSEEIKAFMEEKYNGAVLPSF